MDDSGVGIDFIVQCGILPVGSNIATPDRCVVHYMAVPLLYIHFLYTCLYYFFHFKAKNEKFALLT